VSRVIRHAPSLRDVHGPSLSVGRSKVPSQVVYRFRRSRPPIHRIQVASSAIAALGYCPSKKILEVEFVRGARVYRYYAVPEEVYRAFLNAPSKGTYLNEVIKPAGFRYGNSTPKDPHCPRSRFTRSTPRSTTPARASRLAVSSLESVSTVVH
jgi:KTSC domain